MAAADRVAVEAGKNSVLVGPVPSESPFTGEEVEDIGSGDSITTNVPIDMLQEPVQQACAAVELSAVSPAPGDIVVDRVPEHHASPSRSMPATSRRALSCTLAYTAVDEVQRWPR